MTTKLIQVVGATVLRVCCFFFQAEDGIRDSSVTGVQTCALPISPPAHREYARLTNPTRDALEESLCSLEGGTSAHAFGSGMAAITAMCTMMKTGDQDRKSVV